MTYKFQSVYDSYYSETRIKHFKPGDWIVYCNKLALVLNKNNRRLETSIIILHKDNKIEKMTYHQDFTFFKLNTHNINAIKI